MNLVLFVERRSSLERGLENPWTNLKVGYVVEIALQLKKQKMDQEELPICDMQRAKEPDFQFNQSRGFKLMSVSTGKQIEYFSIVQND